MMSRLSRTKANTKMARLNITYHIGNLARRNNLSAEEAVSIFLTNIRTGTASPYLIGASKIADSEHNHLVKNRVIRWVKQWQNNIPDGQKPRKRKTRGSKVDTLKVAKARLIIIEHLLARQVARSRSLGKEIEYFIKRHKEDRLPYYLKEAIKDGHARPGNLDYVSIAKCTLYEWVRKYRVSGNDIEALRPIPPSYPKPPYANDNILEDGAGQ